MLLSIINRIITSLTVSHLENIQIATIQQNMKAERSPRYEEVITNMAVHCFSELTHEFLQILEKTPSRLKRIRNWRVSNEYMTTHGVTVGGHCLMLLSFVLFF